MVPRDEYRSHLGGGAHVGAPETVTFGLHDDESGALTWVGRIHDRPLTLPQIRDRRRLGHL